MKRRIVLIAAIAAAVIAGILTHFYLAAREAEVEGKKQALIDRYGAMEVLVFAKDLPGGTAIQKSDLGTLTMPAMGMRGQALTLENVTEILGRKTTISHRRGEVVFWSDIEGGDPSAKGLSADVKRQMRAISVSVNGETSVSGMIRPGDRVDVIGTFGFPKPGENRAQLSDIVTCTMLQNVLVLATGTETAKTRLTSMQRGERGYSLVTLEVSPREAEMLAFAQQMKGRLTLTLRNRSDASFEKELPKVDFEMIRGEIETLNLRRQQKIGVN